MVQLLRVRSTVLGLLEQARGRRCVVPLLLCAASLKMNTRQLSSSTEAEVDIILPGIRNDLTSLIKREGTSSHACWRTSTHGLYLVESFLKTLFIVSDVSVIEEGPLGTASLPWLYEDSVPLPGETVLPP
jgi:isoleucyl-tRNA synthetase